MISPPGAMGALPSQPRARVGRSTVAASLLFGLACVLLSVLARAQTPPVEGKRVALLIGNSRYEHTTPLANPHNDVREMARVLTSLGFEVHVHEEVKLRPMLRAIADFARRMSKGGVALFYYSGHALQVSGKNYLIPIDGDLPAEDYVDSDTVELRAVLDKMDRSDNRLNIVVLDACRNNPFARKWASLGRTAAARSGLAPTTAPPGTFVAYATEPDNVASDGAPGSNGVYTGELVKFLAQPGLTIEQVFKAAAANVMTKTNRAQRPWIASNFTGEFYFAKRVAALPPTAPAPSGQEIRVDVGTLVLSARIPGVDVWVDDRKVWTSREGASYVLSNMPTGSYKLVARKAGHRDWTRDVSVAANQRAEIVIDIESLAPATTLKADDGTEMVLVPAGEFWMGSDEYDDEKPRHRLHLDAYYIDRYETTNALYGRFLQATGRAAPSYWNSSQFSGESQPVVGVTWHDADAYCRWAGKRLPTEAEWEKAARGTDGRKYPWGDQWDSSRENSQGKLGRSVAVGSYPTGASPYGVHDMAGNVWEWVADWYDANYYKRSPERNPMGPESGSSRGLRGGSWRNDPFFLRTADRFNRTPDDRNYNVGFRCARGL